MALPAFDETSPPHKLHARSGMQARFISRGMRILFNSLSFFFLQNKYGMRGKGSTIPLPLRF